MLTVSTGQGIAIVLMFAAGCLCYFQAQTFHDATKRRDGDWLLDPSKEAQIVTLIRWFGLAAMGASGAMVLLLMFFPA